METQLRIQFIKLQRSLNQLFVELSDVPEDLLNQKPSSEQWSVLEVMHHLMMAEKGSLAYLNKKIKYLNEKRPAKSGITEMLRSFALTGFLRSPIKAKSPKKIAEFPDGLNFADTQQDWWQLRSDLDQFLENLPNDVLKLAIYKHPLAGRLNIYQCLNFFQAHFDRHRGQIRETLKGISN